MSKMSSKDDRVIVYGKLNSAEAYAIRDFLSRSVVSFKWVELTGVEDYKRSAPDDLSSDPLLPVVQLPSGQTLYRPSITEIASYLGWISQPKYDEYDLSIYGAGPAGLSAAVYAASEGLRTVLIEKNAIGGQAGTSSMIENYMGFPKGISGADLAERARQQAVKFGVEILLLREGIKATFKNRRIHVNLANGMQMVAKANICATGVEYRNLGLEDEYRYLNRGLFYGAGASEAFMCKGQSIFVVGGGNSAGQAAMYFADYANTVSMVVRGSTLASSLSHYLLSRIKAAKNVNVLYNSAASSLHGSEYLEQIEITNNEDGSTVTYATQRLFVCIGGVPNTEWATETDIIRDAGGYLVTGSDLLGKKEFGESWTLDRAPYFLETSVPGSFAAGDVRHGSVKRVASSVGEGAMAVTFVHQYLEQF